MSMEVLTLDPHEVEFGDGLVGAINCPVASIVYHDGLWHYRDQYGNLIVSRSFAGRVQVIRFESIN